MDPAISLTGQLRLFSSGQREIGDSLLREIFPRMRQIAARKLRKEYATPAVTPTDLIGETWLASLHRGKWNIEDREHFFSIVGLAMQNVLTDMARRRLAQRRGSGAAHISLEEISPGRQPASAGAEQVIEISLLLQKLANGDARAASIVRMHYVLGLSLEEVAAATGLTLRQVRHQWQKGKLWLAAQLASPQTPQLRSRSQDRG